ncbi:MAG: hypothetical protein K9M19_08055 [Candidatus Marinimicrobia bacterium]|nr:hypothetical protein [Candidatus Neomarinimicrobiota bacterium]
MSRHSKRILVWLFILAAGLRAQDWDLPDNFVSIQLNHITPLDRGLAYNYNLKPMVSPGSLPLAIGFTLARFPGDDRISEFQLTQSTWVTANDQPVQFTQNAIFMRLKQGLPFTHIPVLPYAGFGLGVNLTDFNYGYEARVDSSEDVVNYTSTSTYLAISGQAMAGVLWFPTERFGLELEVCYQLDYFDNRDNGSLGFLGWLQVLPTLVITF